MLRMKFILVLNLFMIGSLCMAQKSLFEAAKKYNSGSFVHIGTSFTGFINKNFNDNFDNKVLKWSPGISIGYTFVKYPMFYDFGFFSSNFSVNNHDWQYPDKTIISHRGFETSLNMMLLPQIKFLQPYIGIGYNNAAVGVGLYKDEEDKTEVSSVGLSKFIYKCGFNLSFSRKIKSKFDYQRSNVILNNDKSFYRFSFNLLFLFN